MATLGLLGGTSWESTVLYYQHMNRHVRKRLGGYHSASLVLRSVDLAEYEPLQRQGAWQEAAQRFGKEAKHLVNAGAKAIMLCNNTFHIVASEIQAIAGVELIHIVDATAEKIKEQNMEKVILLGTRYTMEADFFRKGLETHGLNAIVPNPAERDEVHRVIYEELVHGVVQDPSRQAYKRIVERMKKNEGAEGVIAGCTEIGMLLSEKDVGLLVFDTSKIHAEKAVEWAIAHGASG